MGDIKTHGGIATEVMALLKKARPNENYMFFELGNFLTDVSQFRDPSAFCSGKIVIWNTGREDHWGSTLKTANMHTFLTDLMGKPRTHGSLAQWFERVIFAIGCEKFRKLGITPDDYEDAYKLYFTQYWPHEHLDFPPWPYKSALGDRTVSDAAIHKCDSPPQEPSAADGGAQKKSDQDKCWIRFLVMDEGSQTPMPGVELRVRTPDDAIKDYVTGDDGTVDIRGFKHGKCSVTCHVQDMVLERTFQFKSAKAFAQVVNPTSANTGSAGAGGQPRFRIADVTEYIVGKNDTLKKIAEANGMTWQKLCQFNFGTSVATEVNKALRTKVGATRKSADGQNMLFSDSDKTRNVERPGRIYIPKQWSLLNLDVDKTHVIYAKKIVKGPDPTPAAATGGSEEKKGTDKKGKTDDKEKTSGRKVLKYLDEQIVYVAELLTVIEQEWTKLVRQGDSADNKRARNRLLTRYGHASHAAEDFYFHSNFIEIAWSRLNRPLPSFESDTQSQRIFYRRKRAPAAEKGSMSTTKSFEAGSICTGAFGSEDINHTLMDAIENLADDMDKLPTQFQGPLSNLTDESKRRKLRDKGERGKFLDEYRKNAKNADTWIEASVAAGKLHRKSADALKEAFKIDNRVFDAYGGILFKVPETIRSPFAFLVELLVLADIAHEQSEAQSAALNKKKLIEDARTVNGASAENIGCHSLLAKDSPKKKPLRRPAINVGTRLATYIAELMVRQVNRGKTAAAKFDDGTKKQSKHKALNTLDSTPGIDWLHLLQHFCCHPDDSEHKWYEKALDDKKAPTHYIVRPADRATIAKRVKEPKMQTLRQMYQTLEDAAEAEFQKLIK